MISEETPLVSSLTTRKYEEVYKRFKPAKKRAIVALVSVTGLLARTPFIGIANFVFHSDGLYSVFVSGTFVPSIPQIAKDLNTTGTTVR